MFRSTCHRVVQSTVTRWNAAVALSHCATVQPLPATVRSTLTRLPLTHALSTHRHNARTLHTNGTCFNAPTDPTWQGNITDGISSKIGRNLHRIPGHPLNIIKNRIVYYFDQRAKKLDAIAAQQTDKSKAKDNEHFTLIEDVSPIVTTKQNFDDLLFKPDHPGRSPSDTFYYNKDSLLRTHTSAHQSEYIHKGLTNFLLLGDCYRRDEIDASHYPVFHQMEGVKIFSNDLSRFTRDEKGVELVVEDLKETLDGLVRYLFGSQIEVRWIDAYFPFTHPSLEMEILFQGKWMEVFGSGVIQYDIMDHALSHKPELHGKVQGYAFGLGLERLAMILFDIPDIRLFWSEDPRFLDQFSKVKEDLEASNGEFKKIKFVPFSKYPPCFKDVTFWVPEAAVGADATPSSTSGSSTAPVFHENDFCSMVREIAGDLVENVTLIDSFTHPKTKQVSKCYRIMYRSLNRNLTNEEIDVLQEQVRQQIGTRLGLKLR